MGKKLVTLILNFKTRVKKINKEIAVLYLAIQRQDMPLLPKIISLLVVGYALSPIDLIPDFIPIIGMLDDMILIPLGVACAIKFIPNNIIMECRQESETAFKDGKPKNWVAGGIVIFIWVLIILYVCKKILYH